MSSVTNQFRHSTNQQHQSAPKELILQNLVTQLFFLSAELNPKACYWASSANNNVWPSLMKQVDLNLPERINCLSTKHLSAFLQVSTEWHAWTKRLLVDLQNIQQIRMIDVPRIRNVQHNMADEIKKYLKMNIATLFSLNLAGLEKHLSRAEDFAQVILGSTLITKLTLPLCYSEQIPPSFIPELKYVQFVCELKNKGIFKCLRNVEYKILEERCFISRCPEEMLSKIFMMALGYNWESKCHSKEFQAWPSQSACKENFKEEVIFLNTIPLRTFARVSKEWNQVARDCGLQLLNANQIRLCDLPEIDYAMKNEPRSVMKRVSDYVRANAETFFTLNLIHLETKVDLLSLIKLGSKIERIVISREEYFSVDLLKETPFKYIQIVDKTADMRASTILKFLAKRLND